MSPLDSLALTLYNIGAVAIGEFKLHSGRIAPIYADLRLLASFPAALREAAAAYRTILETLNFDVIVAPPLGGLPIGTAIALDMNVPLIFPRKTVKKYGMGKQIEGKWEAGQTAVVVDDVTTSGDSIIQTVEVLRNAGMHVTDAIVLLDREQGGGENVEAVGCNFHAALKLSHLLTTLEEHDRITAVKHAEVRQAMGW